MAEARQQQLYIAEVIGCLAAFIVGFLLKKREKDWAWPGCRSRARW